MTPAESITAALTALCARAGVQPDDGTADAGRAVALVWERDGVFADRETVGCPIADWLTSKTGIGPETGGPFVLFLKDRICLRTRATAAATVCEFVALPAAVATAFKQSVRFNAMAAPGTGAPVVPKGRGRKPKGRPEAA